MGCNIDYPIFHLSQECRLIRCSLYLYDKSEAEERQNFSIAKLATYKVFVARMFFGDAARRTHPQTAQNNECSAE